MTRTRNYIPLPERLAATLSCLLPQGHRDQLRSDQVGSEHVIGLFHFDHITFHAIGGSDLWWNLDPKLVAEHRKKTATLDIPAIAKGRRLRAAEAEHQAVRDGASRPQGRIRSRGFDNTKTRGFDNVVRERKPRRQRFL